MPQVHSAAPCGGPSRRQDTLQCRNPDHDGHGLITCVALHVWACSGATRNEFSKSIMFSSNALFSILLEGACRVNTSIFIGAAVLAFWMFQRAQFPHFQPEVGGHAPAASLYGFVVLLSLAVLSSTLILSGISRVTVGVGEVAGPSVKLESEHLAQSRSCRDHCCLSMYSRSHAVGIVLAGFLMALIYLGGEAAQKRRFLFLPGDYRHLFQECRSSSCSAPMCSSTTVCAIDRQRQRHHDHDRTPHSHSCWHAMQPCRRFRRPWRTGDRAHRRDQSWRRRHDSWSVPLPALPRRQNRARRAPPHTGWCTRGCRNGDDLCFLRARLQPIRPPAVGFHDHFRHRTLSAIGQHYISRQPAGAQADCHSVTVRHSGTRNGSSSNRMQWFYLFFPDLCRNRWDTGENVPDYCSRLSVNRPRPRTYIINVWTVRSRLQKVAFGGAMA